MLGQNHTVVRRGCEAIRTNAASHSCCTVQFAFLVPLSVVIRRFQTRRAREGVKRPWSAAPSVVPESRMSTSRNLDRAMPPDPPLSHFSRKFALPTESSRFHFCRLSQVEAESWKGYADYHNTCIAIKVFIQTSVASSVIGAALV